MNFYSALYISPLCLQRSDMTRTVCNKANTQFYLPPTYEPYLPVFRFQLTFAALAWSQL